MFAELKKLIDNNDIGTFKMKIKNLKYSETYIKYYFFLTASEKQNPLKYELYDTEESFIINDIENFLAGCKYFNIDPKNYFPAACSEGFIDMAKLIVDETKLQEAFNMAFQELNLDGMNFLLENYKSKIIFPLTKIPIDIIYNKTLENFEQIIILWEKYNLIDDLFGFKMICEFFNSNLFDYANILLKHCKINLNQKWNNHYLIDIAKFNKRENFVDLYNQYLN